MNKKLVTTVTILLVIGILTPSIMPAMAKPARKLEKKVIIHYRKGYGKPPGTPGVGPDKPSDDDEGSYELLGKGVMWKTTEDLIIDTSNMEGLSQDFVVTTITASLVSWDSITFHDLYGIVNVGLCDGPDEASPDEKNEIMFGDLDEPGVIAVCIVWGYFGGPPKQREIIEYDIVFDQNDFDWGDATMDQSLMDLQNIATHELGHAFGLADLYDSNAYEETMYGYSSEGDTEKRTLYLGDIAGIQNLYGTP